MEKRTVSVCGSPRHECIARLKSSKKPNATFGEEYFLNRPPTLSPSHPPTLSPSHPPTLPPSHPPSLPPSRPPTLSPSHPLTLSLVAAHCYGQGRRRSRSASGLQNAFQYVLPIVIQVPKTKRETLTSMELYMRFIEHDMHNGFHRCCLLASFLGSSMHDRMAAATIGISRDPHRLGSVNGVGGGSWQVRPPLLHQRT